MSFSASLSLIACPSCGEPIMLHGFQFGYEPAHLAETYSNHKKIVGNRQFPATGKFKAEELRPSC
jgi:hypothetical protein